MAYISHSHIDQRTLRERAQHIVPSGLIWRCLVVAAAAVIAILALSEGRSTAPAGAELAVKSDRLVAPVAAGGAEIGRMTVDAGARTTTVERGAVAELSAGSPMSVEAK